MTFSPVIALLPRAQSVPVPGLFDIPDVGRRRDRAELATLVESLAAPSRALPRSLEVLVSNGVH